ncbi:hypothetical protein Deipe_3777 [Deinococcus peraridilitoris DSM 19664]|uniref:Uncharacterized protein n=1 Tax=Deinococcus peraridilitoris (strain DSM 19664 / LMG 22246 / CIP 109416 / KR-200) TaxID=937777 RepID=L0A5S7_DEIPD|nr:hypothetical protein Deipe_3777 [Deinococcus peraridilitoris DSM 19664]
MHRATKLQRGVAAMLEYFVDGMDCPSYVRKIEGHLMARRACPTRTPTCRLKRSR